MTSHTSPIRSTTPHVTRQALKVSALVVAAVVALLLFDSAAAAQEGDTATVRTECYEANGRTDGMLIIDVATDDTGATFEANIGPTGQLTRTIGLGANLTFTIRVSGRPDGPLPVVVTSGGATLADAVLAVDCDPFVGPETAVATGCIGRTGRVDLNVENPGPSSADYTLQVGNLTKTVNVFAGDIERISITGRVDGDYQVTVSKDGVQLSVQTVELRCEPDTASITSRCIADNGFIEIYVPGPDPDLTYAIGNVGPRSYVQTATSNRGVVSGRPDGSHAVALLSATGSVVGTATVEIDCDPGPCDRGYQAVGGECVTPGASACVAPQIELLTYPGIFGPIQRSCIPETDCPWSVFADRQSAAMFRSGLVQCTVALP